MQGAKRSAQKNNGILKMDVIYRPGLDADAAQLIALVEKCYGEYEGCILDVAGEEPQLNYIATHFAEKGGEFWVAHLRDKLVGCVGYTFVSGEFELKHLYVDSAIRRRGIASQLCNRVEQAAKRLDADKIALWTDTRFKEAHQLYENRGFVGGAETRTLNDISNTVEYYYEKSLLNV